MIQMSGSSLAFDLCLLLAYNRYTLSGVDSCVVVAALVHFFSLSTQLWITVAGHCLRATLTLDRTVSDNCWALCKRLLLAWGKLLLIESRFAVFIGFCMIYLDETWQTDGWQEKVAIRMFCGISPLSPLSRICGAENLIFMSHRRHANRVPFHHKIIFAKSQHSAVTKEH